MSDYALARRLMIWYDYGNVGTRALGDLWEFGFQCSC